jgi:thiol-disulfide isomerase/thioredoxin
MRVKSFVGLAAVLSVIASCSERDTTIKGKIDGANEILIARVGTDQLEYLDTIQTSDGAFSFKPGNTEETELLMIEVPQATRLSLYVKPYEKVELYGKADDPGYEYEITGSPGSERIAQINRIMGDLMGVMDSLNEVNNSSLESENYASIKDQLDNIYTSTVDKTRALYLDMLHEDPGHSTNLFIFPLRLGQTQLLPANEYFEEYESADKAMMAENPGNPHAQRFSQRVQQIKAQVEAQKAFLEAEKNAAVGMVAPNITLPDPNGKERSLEDLRGKVVLVDFWASWCRPCRAENPRIVELYNQFNGKGFEIFSVSLDGTQRQPNAKDAWVNAIKDDGLIWDNHVSDLQGWNASATRIYGFQSIPFTLLLDREGKILARGLRGEELYAAVEEAL